jgi:hypothetical protein
MTISKAFDVALNSSYFVFAAANLTGQFDIDPASFATCKMSPGCNSGDLLQGRRFGRQPLEKAAATAAGGKLFPAFSPDYTAVEETFMLSNQGGEVVGDDVCCLPGKGSSVNGECLVTRSAKRGTHYVDVTNQRERFEDAVSGQTHVTFYGKIDMDMLINVSSAGVETCAEVCPLLPGESLDGLAIDPNATDMGSATVPAAGGKAAERFECEYPD